MIHADHNATTPPLPEVIEAMVRCLRDGWGNPSSRQHALGRRALAILDDARQALAALIGAREDEIVFTSGATESVHLAILGVAQRSLPQRPLFAAAASEHAAVLGAIDAVVAAGGQRLCVALTGEGVLVPTPLPDQLALMAVMLVNNETGVVQDVPAWSHRAHAAGAVLLCDASQAPGRLPINVTALGADLLALSAHKCHGPAGVGALWIKRGLGLAPLMYGGGQERGLRPGTQNLAGIAGFAVAARLALVELEQRRQHLELLTAGFEHALTEALPGVVIHGWSVVRAPGTSMLSHAHARRGWLARLAGVAASGGSACSGGGVSHVLSAMGVPADQAGNALRISFGRDNTAAEAAAVARAVVHSSGVNTGIT